MTRLSILCLAAVACLCAAQSPEDLQLDAADRQVARLSPAAFPGIPKNLLADLQRRGCTIPQVPMIKGRHNVIQGEFAKPGQSDWAVLCSVKRVSSILIFWNGAESHPAEIEKAKDIDRLQSWRDNRIVYSRAITAVGKAYIDEHYAAFGGPKPPPINHQGVDDAFWGKASVVRYFHQGKWLELTGAD